MKRRDFVKTTTLATLGAALVAPLTGLADEQVTYFESDDLSPRTAAPADGFALHFMALGDWGRNGEYDQAEVAKQMGAWGANNPNDFVVSVGDNIYPKGVVSELDPLWHYSFESIYTAHSLQCDWYPVLGNHDYITDPDAQLRYSKISRRWDMPARYYKKEFDLDGKGKVLMVMIDTDPFLFEEKKAYCDTQLSWINDTLKSAAADVKWKLVIGHHPCYTVGPRITNYDTITLRKALSETLVNNKVDLYLSGHDHSLQHLKPDVFIHQFISGAGSELTPIHTGIAYSRFEASEHGFMYFSVGANAINVKAINMSGKVLYDTTLTK